MADVKWIKITTDIFDDEKILLIESLPDAYAIITVWFKLLCLAGKQNNSGVFMMGKIAYTDKMLATIFRMKESTVTMALQTFEQFGMIEIIDGVITIPNWGKHQNLEQLEERRNYQREYQREYRKKQKLLASSDADESKDLRKHLRKQNVNSIEEEKDKEKDGDKEINKEKTDYQKIIALFNSICISLPSVRSLSASRKKDIKARLNTYSIDDIKQCFENAESSSFLKGKNDRRWKATFDWLMKDSNFAKVLDGNFADTNRGDSIGSTQAFFEAAVLKSWEEKKPQSVADDPALQARADKLKKQLIGG